MTYDEAIAFLYDRLPVFHRVGVSAYKPGLTNIRALCEAIGNPHHQFRSIHVAGTNGKGSTSHLLASIYQSAGYRVGLYTSPHLQSFTERIRLNGQPIPEPEVAAFVEEHRALIEQIQPSFFEVTVAMAFAFFARQQVDLAVVEVGLGGRLDSTNIITPLASVITNIGWDHMDILGYELPLIATEKAGIIKSGVPVVIGETHPETQPVFVRMAAEQGAPIQFADQQWQLEDNGLANGVRQVTCRPINQGESADTLNLNRETLAISLPLLGLYQLANLKTMLATVQTLQVQLPVLVSALTEGCRLVAAQTGLKGRFQWLQQQPTVIADTAHNEPGVQALLATIATVPHRRLRLVLGFVRDKDVANALMLFPQEAVYYFCQAHTPRALAVDKLAGKAAELGREGTWYEHVDAALQAALTEADPADLILITGSTYVVAELTYL